mgnify:CR=1 FL=1
MNQELLLLEDICPLLHIGKTTAYRLIQSGLLPAFKIGGKWLIKSNDLENYINSIIPPKN